MQLQEPPAISPEGHWCANTGSWDPDEEAWICDYCENWMAPETVYTLAQLRNGTNFPQGARFIMLPAEPEAPFRCATCNELLERVDVHGPDEYAHAGDEPQDEHAPQLPAAELARLIAKYGTYPPS